VEKDLAGPPEAIPEANFEGAAVDFKWDGRPVRLHFATEDDHIAKIVRNTKTFYEVEMLRDIRARLFFAKCAVDVGAHVGNHTVFFAHVLGLRTIAFEPNPASFRHLKSNISANAIGERCQLHNLAVGHQRGRALLRLEGAERNSGAVGVQLTGRGDVEVIALDEALRNEPQVDIIKIDVEGFEVRVLEGARATIDRHRPIIYVESNQRDFAAVCNILEEARYVCWMRFNFTPTFLFLPQERLHVRRTRNRWLWPVWGKRRTERAG
jgi:FkbM family methyltransferase